MDHRRWEPRVAVIGAGLGGVATAVHLRRIGADFTVFERAEGPGGVWWHNTYPGCEVDVASAVYSYSFLPYRWSTSHAPQRELQSYITHVIDTFGIGDRFRYKCGVESVRWDDRRGAYELTTEHGEAERFDVVVSCLGMLSEPNIPAWAEAGEFAGPMFHTSRYRHDIDLTGLRVAVVGTGSTACQLAPAIAPVVGQLDVYQREPGWVSAKAVTPVAPDLYDRYARWPLLRKAHRYRAFYRSYRNRGQYSTKSKANANAEARARAYLDDTVLDPEVRAALTPSFPYGCKRQVYAAGYYEIFNRPDVRLIPKAVTRLTREGLVDVDGVERPADVIVLSTGYQATRYQASLHITGRHGADLQQVWAGEPRAFVGMTVPGFPNFFMLYGPNTNGAMSIISPLERQAEAVARAVRRLRRTPGSALDTRPKVADAYDAWIQRRMLARDVERGGCHNYYFAATGKNVTQLPMSAPAYMVATKVLPALGWRRLNHIAGG